MKMPDQCQNMSEIRREIDALDYEIIRLLGQRLSYVQAASKFKTDEASVRAPARFQSMLEVRRDWAQAAGLNADVVEKMYRDLVTYFIEEEMLRLKNLENNS